MKIALIGLGRMGHAIAYRLLKDNHKVLGYDPAVKEIPENLQNFKNLILIKNLKEIISQNLDAIWLMVPAGQTIDKIIQELLKNNLQENSIIIDGGNSYYKDTIKRFNFLKTKNINYMDCGTSGGLLGEKIGFSLMIGGEQNIFEKLEPIFKSIAHKDGYDYMGPTGAGHYVKMVHNGIEYSILQGYAEGFNLLKNNNNFKNLNLEKISKTWQNGSVIRSWILDLAHNIFAKDQELKNISGNIGENKTGQWTLQECKEQNIPMDLLERSLQIREWSRESGGNYATKVVAMLRNAFGGHEIKKN
ncbi:decarboxylating 6-phosphogluconate dehydrogenase [Candidatus Babeliales bacterium]|nr:decarboxylating 6-phosphogluconate dehydrogenase [Candidatus Babeliales bacterium]MCF7899725.1 decarboxylating 6-phosphogluconate dehydrogenase [Candidatus Babeliales bacterium]